MAMAYELGYDECLTLLSSRRTGRVAVGAPDGPHIVPVNYTVHEGTIYIRTTPYSVLGTYGRNTQVAFEVDQVDDEERVGWSVVARGRCNAVLDPSEIRRINLHAGPQPWAAGHRTLLLALQWRELTGRRLAHDPAELAARP
ncbi:pyridoxamine 5'-phosphate oxidase family protein [Nocardioides marmoribigeumensis]|uniref:Nitroimidazol reductase NimA-like FMN-containing flavoprotein (Pyridoxamine 5'-phosphate oxidase superfamily) n=1 Tax=Nocardioides marmoribigeumensis TaxID=433649 RepID=A0ABU2BTB9_9ACTN|nr:pyridoxamine 5'-phosphate oxidase family protein [Nocardioides marmoribigeumensis]MDR7361878.1 nitroimidazol reductase NimA-like FMN-containing flavoprotein (pyridoxamine 5'-phosphate oxidase superfamily) [Nocardioides marmoribigeumensis]